MCCLIEKYTSPRKCFSNSTGRKIMRVSCWNRFIRNGAQGFAFLTSPRIILCCPSVRLNSCSSVLQYSSQRLLNHRQSSRLPQGCCSKGVLRTDNITISWNMTRDTKSQTLLNQNLYANNNPGAKYMHQCLRNTDFFFSNLAAYWRYQAFSKTMNVCLCTYPRIPLEI
jgi:hypothetical protein